ncbi:MAG TPA: DUF6756 family protein [Myxococcaceae bacterium]|nr:DUF6756 family protein [Myxococcaceae bacterium]
MDTELATAISTYVATKPEIRLLKDGEAELVRTEVARRFEFSDQQAWWWEHVPSPVKSLAYSDGEGLRLLSTVLPAETQRAYLFVTDDDPPPWLCVSGPPHALLELVAQQRFFEFFIVDEGMTWIVFDTHHNTLVGHGESLAMRSGG